MSEHIGIKGECEYYHLPFGEDGGMTWCHFCKGTMKKAHIILHNGIASDWIEMKCGRCKRTIWVAEFTMKKEVLNEKCAICKKPTSYHNNHCTCYTKGKKYNICSAKCNKIFEKRTRREK